jgi:hypothetical protein
MRPVKNHGQAVRSFRSHRKGRREREGNNRNAEIARSPRQGIPKGAALRVLAIFFAALCVLCGCEGWRSICLFLHSPLTTAGAAVE